MKTLPPHTERKRMRKRKHKDAHYRKAARERKLVERTYTMVDRDDNNRLVTVVERVRLH